MKTAMSDDSRMHQAMLTASSNPKERIQLKLQAEEQTYVLDRRLNDDVMVNSYRR